MTNKTADLEILSPTPENIAEIISHNGSLHVSIYLPVKNDAPETEKNPTRLKQLLQTAKKELSANGMKDDRIEATLAPARNLMENPRQLLELSPGVAIFLDGERHKAIRLTEQPDPYVDVSNRFYIKPLIPSAFLNPTYTVLCLNRGDVQAFRGTRTTLEEAEIEGMPNKLSDITAIDDPEKTLQQHTAKTTSAQGRPGSSPAMQTHGQGLPADYETSQFKRFFREVAKSVHQFLSDKKDLLIVFGVEQNVGLFREQYKWNAHTILEKVEDPHEWNRQRLQKEAWQLVQPVLDQDTQDQLELFSELAGKNQGIFKVEEAAMGAATGRIDTVLIASNEAVYGICNPESMEVRLVDREEPGCAHDLLDYVASETIKHGGKVLTLPKEKIPGGGSVAASTRF